MKEPDVGHWWFGDSGVCHSPCGHLLKVPASFQGALSSQSVPGPRIFIQFDQNQDFLDLTNPKAVLEMRLRHFACLSKGDIVAINYNNKVLAKSKMIMSCDSLLYAIIK